MTASHVHTYLFGRIFHQNNVDDGAAVIVVPTVVLIGTRRYIVLVVRVVSAVT